MAWDFSTPIWYAHASTYPTFGLVLEPVDGTGFGVWEDCGEVGQIFSENGGVPTDLVDVPDAALEQDCAVAIKIVSDYS